MRFVAPAAILPGLLIVALGFLYGQTTPATPGKLTARELFYLAQDTPPAKPANHPAQAQHASHVTNHTIKTTSSSGALSSSETSGVADARDASTTTPDSTARVENVSYTGGQYPPLGLRYAVFRATTAGEKGQAVEADTSFHSNDHIQFTVDVSAPGYLYVISRGSSGRWSVLFPSSEADVSASLVQPRHTYTFPPESVLTFTDPAGEEKVFLFLTRQPVRSTEDLMLQMSNGSGNASPTSAPKPSALPQAQVIEAFNRMDDSQVAALQTTYSRDLIVEKVNTDTASSSTGATPAHAPAKDNSVYVVDPSKAANAHVVAELTFRHE